MGTNFSTCFSAESRIACATQKATLGRETKRKQENRQEEVPHRNLLQFEQAPALAEPMHPNHREYCLKNWQAQARLPLRVFLEFSFLFFAWLSSLRSQPENSFNLRTYALTRKTKYESRLKIYLS
jgi:hypothetical protein